MDIIDVVILNGKEADFIDKLGRSPSDLPPTLEKDGLSSDHYNRRGLTAPSKNIPQNFTENCMMD